MQQTSGESDQLFDEDVESSKLNDDQDDYGEQNLAGNSVSDGALQTPKQPNENMTVGASLNVANYKRQGSGEEASIVLSDKEGKANDSNEFDSQESEQDLDKETDWQWIFLQEHMQGEPQPIPQSVIYELINETINKEAFNVSCPTPCTFGSVMWYIFVMPLTHT